MEKDFTKQKEAFAELLDIMETLREKCPWDHKQTMESLRTLSVEEVYELGDAILKNDMQEVKKELGDLLMHIVFYALIGKEVKVEDENDVLRNWEQLKLKEKGRHNKVLEGVPDALPALVKAYRIQDKVRGVGFDWKQKEDVWQKVREELGELEVEVARKDQERMEEEFGDFMFAMINAARLYGINPEDALEKSNKKFIRRFSYVEKKAHETERNLSDMTLEEMDEYWNEAKAMEKA